MGNGPAAHCTPVPEGTEIAVVGAPDPQSIPTDSTNHKSVSRHHSGGSGGKSLKMIAFAEGFDIPKNSPIVIVQNATVKSVDSSKTAHLRGQIMNVGQKALTVNAIVATFYDMVGNIGASSSYPTSPSHVNLGQSVPFDVSFSDDKRTPYNPFKDTSWVKYQIDWTEKER